MSCPQFPPPATTSYRGTILLRSAWRRLLFAALISAALWLLTAYAIGWV